LWEASQQLQQFTREREDLQQKLEALQQLYAAAAERANHAAAAAAAGGRGSITAEASAVHDIEAAAGGGMAKADSRGFTLRLDDVSSLSIDANAGDDAAVGGSQQNLSSSAIFKGSMQLQRMTFSNGVTPQQQQQQWLMHDSNSSSKLSGGDAVMQLQRSLQQLQQELASAVQERDAAQEQLYQAVRRADAAAAALQDAEKWKSEQQELEKKVSCP
jgi:hypothetical protein